MKPSSMNRLIATALVLSAAACKPPSKSKGQQQAPAPTVAPAKPAAKLAPVVTPIPAEPPPRRAPIGMEDPFARVTPPAYKALKTGWKALLKKQYPEARAAFHQVVAANPDHTDARFLELKATVLQGDLGAVPGMWRELLSRDFVTHRARLDRAQEMAPLRASEQWAKLQAIEEELGRSYASGLDTGLFFVARTRIPSTPELREGQGGAKLELDQEAYHFDPSSKRIRRLSDSGGHLVAIHPDSEQRRLIMLMAGELKKVAGGTVFSKLQAAVVSLDTLERSGSMAIHADALSVDLCFSGKGEPVWSVSGVGASEPKAVTLDATGAVLVSMDVACESSVAITRVSPLDVEHLRPQPEGVELSDDGLELTGVDEDRPLRATRAIDPGSFAWSPGKKRFAYTGRVDRCDLVTRIELDDKPARNPLLVWDADRKKSSKVSSAFSSYETKWLDDDHLAFESRLDRATRLTILDFSPGGVPLTLRTPAGAGLFGIPTLDCGENQIHAMVP